VRGCVYRCVGTHVGIEALKRATLNFEKREPRSVFQRSRHRGEL